MSLRRMIMANAITEKMIEGTLPLSVYARKNVSASDYRIFGNSEKTETEVVGVGERTNNLNDYSIPIKSLGNSSVHDFPIDLTNSSILLSFDVSEDYYWKITDMSNYKWAISLRKDGAGKVNINYDVEEGFSTLNSTCIKPIIANKRAAFLIKKGGNFDCFRFNPNAAYEGSFYNICISYVTDDENIDIAYEPFGYKIPVVDTHDGEGSTFNVYLKSPLMKVGDVADYIDYKRGVVVRNVLGIDLGVYNWTLFNNNSGTIFWYCQNPTFETIKKNGDWPVNYIVENTDYQGKIAIVSSSMMRIYTKDTENQPSGKVFFEFTTPTEEAIELPTISLSQGSNTIDTDTTLRPSSFSVTGKAVSALNFGEPFLDANGFHLLAPSWLNEGDEMEWAQVFPKIDIFSLHNINDYELKDDYLRVFSESSDVNHCILFDAKENVIGDTYLCVFDVKCEEPENNKNVRFRMFGGYINYYYPITEYFNRYSKVAKIKSTETTNQCRLCNILGNVYIKQPFAFNISKTNAPSTIETADQFAAAFGYSSIDAMPYFDPIKNGTLIVHNGKLYKSHDKNA